MSLFEDQAQICADAMQAGLDALLTVERLSGPGPAPERLLAAMRHGTLSGGKRVRPLLMRQSAELCGLDPKKTINAALAIELVHSYSLIHDDLPSMDDDDMRRGQPTVHMLFDEATAILAGDTLLTLAFQLLAEEACHPDPAIRIALVTELAAGSGAGGMAGGQLRDLEGEKARLTGRDISIMQQMKTGALIRAAVRMGAILAGATSDQLESLTRFAEISGRAFQLADDILDATATEEQMGKRTGKDAKRGKQTLIAEMGLEDAQLQLGNLIGEATKALEPFGEKAKALRETARYFAERQN